MLLFAFPLHFILEARLGGGVEASGFHGNLLSTDLLLNLLLDAQSSSPEGQASSNGGLCKRKFRGIGKQ